MSICNFNNKMQNVKCHLYNLLPLGSGAWWGGFTRKEVKWGTLNNICLLFLKKLLIFL